MPVTDLLDQSRQETAMAALCSAAWNIGDVSAGKEWMAIGHKRCCQGILASAATQGAAWRKALTQARLAVGDN